MDWGQHVFEKDDPTPSAPRRFDCTVSSIPDAGGRTSSTTCTRMTTSARFAFSGLLTKSFAPAFSARNRGRAPRKNEDGENCPSRSPLRSLHDLESVHARHVVVEDDRVVAVLAGEAPRPLAWIHRRRDGYVSRAAQRPAKQKDIRASSSSTSRTLALRIFGFADHDSSCASPGLVRYLFRQGESRVQTLGELLHLYGSGQHIALVSCFQARLDIAWKGVGADETDRDVRRRRIPAQDFQGLHPGRCPSRLRSAGSCGLPRRPNVPFYCGHETDVGPPGDELLDQSQVLWDVLSSTPCAFFVAVDAGASSRGRGARAARDEARRGARREIRMITRFITKRLSTPSAPSISLSLGDHQSECPCRPRPRLPAKAG